MPVLSAADPSNPSEVGPRPHWQQQKRPRIPVGKMFGMPKGRALVWLPGDEAPRISWVKGYFEIPRLRRRASLNPYYKGASAKKKTLKRSFAAAALVICGIGVGTALHHSGEHHQFGEHNRAARMPAPEQTPEPRSEIRSADRIAGGIFAHLAKVAEIIGGLLFGFALDEPKLTRQQAHDAAQAAGNVETQHARGVAAQTQENEFVREWQAHDLNPAGRRSPG